MPSYKDEFKRYVEQYDKLKAKYKGLQDAYLISMTNETELRQRVAQLEREAKGHHEAARGTMATHVQLLRWSISKMRELHDEESADRLEVWLSYITERLVPVADVEDLINLLIEWQKQEFHRMMTSSYFTSPLYGDTCDMLVKLGKMDAKPVS